MRQIRLDPARLAVATVLTAGFAVCLALNLPGHFSYDSVVQLAEARAGAYTGEHPAVMSWLLGLADAVSAGAAAFVVADMALIWGALAALTLIAPRVSWFAVGIAAASAVLPQLALYPGIVWKDVLFAGASASGFACLAWAAARWDRGAARWTLLAGALALLTLAALTRQNGALVLPFAGLAVGATAGGGASRRRFAVGTAAGLSFLAISAVALIVTSAALATRVATADPNADAWAALQTYDVVGAAHRDPGLDLAVLAARDPALRRLMLTRGVAVYSPARVDSIEPVLAAMDPDGGEDAAVASQWRALILGHPLLYLRVRLDAFGWVLLTPDAKGCVLAFTGVSGPAEEMGESGLTPRKDARDHALADYAFAFAGTPAVSHGAYAVVALASLIVLLRRRRPADIAVAAMLGAALAFAASFAIISIACDYRYLYDLDIAAIAGALYLAAGWRQPSRPTVRPERDAPPAPAARPPA